MSQSEGPSKTDLAYEIVYNPRFVPARSPGSSVKTDVDGPQTTHQLRIGQAEYGAAQFYLLDEGSSCVWSLIDGVRTVGNIVRESLESKKVQKPEEVYGTLLFLAQSGALKAVQDPVPWKRVRVASSFMTQIALIRDSTTILASVHRAVRPLLRGSLFWASMVVVILGVAVYAPRFNSIFNDRTNFQILGSTVVGFLFYNFVVLAPVIVIHEMAHGLALLHYSGRSGEVGTGWFYFGPTFYVDVTRYWGLPRRQRIMIMWAGNLSTILIGSILVLSELFFNYPTTFARTIDVAAFWCFYGTLWNLAPPFETDGYYMLADILKIPNLRHEGFSYFKTRALRLFGRSAKEPEGLTPRKRATLLGYAVFSIVALGYIGYQALRFATYMGLDAASWAGRLSSSLGGGGPAPVAFVVGLTSIGYFGLTLSGYGVLVGNQVRKSLVRGLQFEAIHDRNLSVFFYLPASIPTSLTRKFEARIRKLAAQMSPSPSLGRVGPLFYANVKMGGGTVPLSEIKLHLRRIEARFYRAYQHLLAKKDSAAVRYLTRLPFGSESLPDLLWEMASMVPAGERAETRQVLKEFLQRRLKNLRYLLDSTFSTAWTIEIPPAEQQQLLEDLLPRLLVEDIAMTNLAEETEEFKKNIIYGLDTIAELARSASARRDQILAKPEKFQLVPLFEPVRGRIVFVGRTERIEKGINQLGSLFIIQIWSGYTDNLLEDTNLTLYSIAQSLPQIPEDLTSLRDGEVKALQRMVSGLSSLEASANQALSGIRQATGPSRTRLKDLKTLVQLEGMPRTSPLDSILALNMENIKSIPTRLKDSADLSSTSFGWARALSEPIEAEMSKRRVSYVDKKRKFLLAYSSVVLLSIVLIAAGLFLSVSLVGLSLLAAGLSLLGAWVGRFYVLWHEAHRVSRHPSSVFDRLLAPVYALSMTFYSLLVGAGAVNPSDMLGNKEGGEADQSPERSPT